MPETSERYRWLAGQGEAFGAPGLEPRWTSSAKDVVGTAYSTASPLWYTVSHGTLNEIYYPTIDEPQVRDLELLITDGETFFHEEKRDLLHEFAYLDGEAPAVRLTNRDPAGRYTITKEVLSDPHLPVLLMRLRVDGDEQLLRRLKIYALLAPHLGIGGAGNHARVLDVAGVRVIVAWKETTTLAMAASCGFTRASCGFVGTSDGWQDLVSDFRMDWEFGSATNGNIAVMGEIDSAQHREFTIAVGFGMGLHAALTSTIGSLNAKFDQQRARFIEQWQRTKCPLELASASGDKGTLLQTSFHVLLAHEDKTFAGAFIASASIPWGQSKGDADLGGYHLVWTRDMVQSATALLALRQERTALRALVYLACTQKPDGGFNQNFWVDGKPYWGGVQLDETAFPIILAWRLWKLGALGEFDVLPFVERAAGFLVRHAPVTEQERWEECAGYSPSTLAAVISALICAAELARADESAELAQFFEEQADWIESHLEEWTTTQEGTLAPGITRHYIRIRPPACGQPYALPNCGSDMLRLNNRVPGEPYEFPAKEIVDAGFLELVRYGIRAADDPIVVDSLKVVDAVLKRDLPQGPCWRRYNHDGYGQQKDGGPYEGYGQGQCWPLLTGERAHYELAAGNGVQPLIRMLEASCSAGGMLPEQLWDRDDIPERGMTRGQPTGSAMPLVWAHAEYAKLLRSVSDGVVFDRISTVAERYSSRRSARARRSAGIGNGIEVWRQNRPAPSIAVGQTLRIQSEAEFQLTVSRDDWKTAEHLQAKAVGFAGFYADVETRGAGGKGAIAFTFFWPGESRWEGKNYEVLVEK